MADRRVTETAKDRKGRILALCNPGAPWSPRRTADAVRDIRFGLHRYVAVGGGREAVVRAVGGHSGTYLRSDWDATTKNNLDDLPDPSAGNPLTGLSEAVLQVREATVKQLVRAMHRTGATEHRAVWATGDRRVELSLGATERMVFLPTEADDTMAHAEIELPVLYHSRPLDAADDAGETAIARIHVRARVTSGAGPGGLKFLIDWSETRDADVDVAGSNHPLAAKDIGAFARQQGFLAHNLQLPGLTDHARVSELTTAFRQGGRGNLVELALSFASPLPQPKNRITGEIFLERDWALALSEHLVTDRIREGLRQDLGSLPPPFGAVPVGLPGQADVFLDSFDVRLADGAIVFEGVLRRDVAPVVTASYSAEVKLKLTRGGRVQARVGKIKVQTREWYAAVADFFSGGAISGAVERGLRDSLGETAGGRLSTLFSTELLRAVASAGRTRAIDAEPVVEKLEVQEAGVVAQGRLDVTDLDTAPVAAFSALPSKRGPRWRILHAGASWAPSCRLAEFRWSLGDGREEAHKGFVLEHKYPAGRSTTRLTVTDDGGRTASVAYPVEVE